MLEKTYDSASAEPRIAALWDKAGAFKAGAGSKPGAEPFCIVIPPPNVTGSLHMGHALNNTLQDVLIRFERMRGKDVLWQPGMDHAGIATQMVVERQLAASGANVSRREMGREKFVEKVWKWKAESGGLIFNQLKRLGASCDWSRERFTMDEGLSNAVLEVFVTLYNQGLIYKDKRLVNWDPKLQTAISDLEVEQREVNGSLYYFRYPIEGEVFDLENPATFITVATTRPETMLGDTGVAVHPDDTRYQHLVGRHVILPLASRSIRIFADTYSDPEKGTGAVKITPAHDFNDFEVGKHHGLKQINILTTEAKIFLKENSDFNAGLQKEIPAEVMALDGLDRFEARKKIVELMEAGGYLAKVEPHVHQVPHGDRGGVPIEPFLTEQWYVNAAELAKPAIASVREGRTKIVPETWEKTYFQWMENIQPWCISRQLWWGHQIPAWYGPSRNYIFEHSGIRDGKLVRETKLFVGNSENEATAQAKDYYGRDTQVDVGVAMGAAVSGEAITNVTLIRDPDVLDTWFSSALWPFSTLGWPEKTPELAKYYQTDVLVTGFDIIFFWVARMMMMGLHFMHEEPFHTVYVHALVRDKDGHKMSKSKGNVIDPLELIDEYGADALRFTLAIMAAQGRDVKLDPTRIAGYRNFGTKLWNATRFAEMNGMKPDPAFRPENAKLAVNRWILTELTRCASAVTEAITTYRFNDAAGAAYKFVWNQLCDWHLELLKPVFMDEDETAKAEAQAVLAYVLDETYKLLHPFMPFITEELWALTAAEGTSRQTLLCHALWPVLSFADAEAAGDLNWLIDTVSAIRSVRAEMNVPPATQAPLIVVGANAVTLDRLKRHDAAIRRLARVSAIQPADLAPKGSVQLAIGEATGCLPLGSLIDLVAERARLEKEIARIDADSAKIMQKLGNERFVTNAKPEIVAAERARQLALESERQSVSSAMQRLADL